MRAYFGEAGQPAMTANHGESMRLHHACKGLKLLAGRAPDCFRPEGRASVNPQESSGFSQVARKVDPPFDKPTQAAADHKKLQRAEEHAACSP